MPGGRVKKEKTLARTQLARMLQLLLALQGDRSYNAGQLADLCEASRRTIYRDLACLEQAGVPVRYCPVRGGYRILFRVNWTPPPLEEREALGLIAAAASGGADAAGLGREARLAAFKLAGSLKGPNRAMAEEFLAG